MWDEYGGYRGSDRYDGCRDERCGRDDALSLWSDGGQNVRHNV